jgi:LysM repeat protein
MKYFFTICILGVFLTNSVYPQGKALTHKIEKGETINQIAQKYQVTPFDIYQLNPDAQSGLKVNGVLLIPNKAEKKVTTIPAKSKSPVTHEVLPKETLYGIEKKYDVSDEDLKKANPVLEKDGLQTGQVLVIPSKNSAKTTALISEKAVYHEVLPKETKFSIAKKYGITIEQLEKKNPEIIPNLPIGYKLLIKGNAPKETRVAGLVNPIKAAVKNDYVNYEVQPKETLYSLSNKFGMSQEEFVSLNPELKNGVEIGMILKVPAKFSSLGTVKKEYATLSAGSSQGSRKKMVLLLPFNLSKIAGDSVNSVATRLKKDKFLNMTLDFYSGAMMAIDSARTLNLPVDVAIYDSQETKSSSNVAVLIKDNNLGNANAIIGPFYQNNAESTAHLLTASGVPVISPLSKDLGNPIPNLYESIPSIDVVKNTMFDYMRAKKGNIVAVVDRKKESVIKYIKENHKDVRFAALTETGGLSVESLNSLLIPNKMNYVVMETANTWMIKSTVATLLKALPNYRVQLVILEPNATLDTDEVSFLNLAKLKLMYPSVNRDNQSPDALLFEKKYRKLNMISPSDFATRGFDITFDTMMRLAQNKSFEETINAAATTQVDNKFEYYQKEQGGYANKGVFVLYYDTDLTIKEAN